MIAPVTTSTLVAPLGTALIVEDERVIALDLKRSLERCGYQVPMTVSSGLEAVSAAESFPPQLVLMDLRLRGALDGIATALRLRERFEFALIYVTGGLNLSNDADRTRLRASDPDAWLPKPYSSEQLELAVATAIARRSAH